MELHPCALHAYACNNMTQLPLNTNRRKVVHNFRLTFYLLTFTHGNRKRIHMFDILVYLFETYYTPQACHEADVLGPKLAAVGFEYEAINEALGWWHGQSGRVSGKERSGQ